LAYCWLIAVHEEVRHMNAEAEGPRRDGLSRGDLLRRAAVVGAVASLPAVGTAQFGVADAATVTATRQAVLTPGQTAVLEALVNRLIPADANGPSGTDAGVAAYISHALSGGLAGGIAATAPLYSAGLTAVDAWAQSAHGGVFTALTPDKQDAVITDIESGKATGFTPNSATFFAILHEHSLQGMFGDPVYGGNKNFAGWDLVRYPGVKMPVTPAEQRLGVAVKPAHRSAYSFPGFAAAKRQAQA
jgi:gluconate 2-dehydrogenase gamma chain